MYLHHQKIQKSAIILIVIFTFFGLVSKVHASTYYVDNCDITGNDTNNGTSISTPWLTINKVNTSSFVAGDTISFRKGCTWREQLTIPSSGTAGNVIIFGSYGATGEKPIINGSNIIALWTAYSTDTSIWTSAVQSGGAAKQDSSGAAVEWRNLIKSNHISADGTLISFRLDASSAAGTNINNASVCTRSGTTDDCVATPERITFNSGSGNIALTAGQSVWSDYLSYNLDNASDQFVHLEFTGDTSRRFGGDGLLYYNWSGGHTFDATWASDGSLTQTFMIEEIKARSTSSTVWQATVTTEPKQVFFDGTLGTKVASIAAVNSTGKWYWASNVLYIYSASDPGTAYTNPGIEASTRDYGIYFNGGAPVWGGAYVTVQDLTTTKANLYGINIGASDHVLSGATVQRCLATKNYDVGIFSWVPTSMSGTISILNNEASYNGLQSGLDGTTAAPVGIEILGSDSTYGTIVQGNNIHHNYWGMELDQGSANTTVKENTIHDNTQMGVNIDRSDNNRFLNNLVYNHANWGLRIWSATHSTVTSNIVYNNTFYNNQTGIIVEDEQTNLKIKNNIFSTNTQTTSAEEINMQSGKTYSGLDMDYNIYYRPSGTTYWKYGATNYSFANWKTNTSQDRNSLNSDPKFITPGSVFSLQSSSPAINTGVDVNLTTDILGNLIRGIPDIGAYEYQSPNKTITTFDFSGLTPAITGIISEGSHTIALSVPYGTAVTSLTPTITTSGLSVAPTTAVAQDFTNPVTYTVTAEDGTTQIYTVTVTIASAPALIPTTVGSNGPIVGSLGHRQTAANFIAPATQATTSLTSLQNQLTQLTAQLQSLIAQKNTLYSRNGSTTSPLATYTFTRDLSLNSKSTDVLYLQKLLNSLGFTISPSAAGSPGNETTLFGTLTYKALQRFQKSVGLPATSFFGPATRGYVNGR